MFDDDIANSCCEKICQNVTIVAGGCIKYEIKRVFNLSNTGKCGKQVKYLTSEVTRPAWIYNKTQKNPGV